MPSTVSRHSLHEHSVSYFILFLEDQGIRGDLSSSIYKQYEIYVEVLQLLQDHYTDMKYTYKGNFKCCAVHGLLNF